MRTLVVEDDAITRRLLTRALEGRGHEVVACNDAESAWPLYEREPFPLIFLDWMLPGMDGLELCRKMRGLPHGDLSVIVVSTARDQPTDLSAVLAAGADDYIAKPLDVRLLAVRLTIAEKQVKDLERRKRAEDALGQPHR